jgi:hypothetical protein
VNKKSTTKGSFGLIEYKPPKLNYVPVVNTTAGAEYIELPVSATEALAHHDLWFARAAMKEMDGLT